MWLGKVSHETWKLMLKAGGLAYFLDREFPQSAKQSRPQVDNSIISSGLLLVALNIFLGEKVILFILYSF